MSERGVFAVDRGIWSDPDFPNEPFTEREAFLWLVGEAAWRATKTRVGTVIVELERGQCAFSTRFMAAKFQWSEARVRRFLKRRSDLGQLSTKTDAAATRISICKYDAFQRVGLPSDAAATQERRTSDAKKKQGNKETVSNETDIIPDERVTALREVLDEEHATALHEHRTLKSPKGWTARAAGMMAKELARGQAQGLEPNEASEAIIRNGWTGFSAAWLLKDRRGLRIVNGQPPPRPLTQRERIQRELLGEPHEPEQPHSPFIDTDFHRHARHS